MTSYLMKEIEDAEVKIMLEKAKLENIEHLIDQSRYISSVLCEEGLKTQEKIKNMEADLVGMYLDKLLTVYPWFKGEALYEEAIKNVIGKNGFDLLHCKGIIELCGRTANGVLYTY